MLSCYSDRPDIRAKKSSPDAVHLTVFITQRSLHPDCEYRPHAQGSHRGTLETSWGGPHSGTPVRHLSTIMNPIRSNVRNEEAVTSERALCIQITTLLFHAAHENLTSEAILHARPSSVLATLPMARKAFFLAPHCTTDAQLKLVQILPWEQSLLGRFVCRSLRQNSVLHDEKLLFPDFGKYNGTCPTGPPTRTAKWQNSGSLCSGEG